MFPKMGGVLGVLLSFSLGHGHAEEMTRPTGDRVAFNPSSAHVLFGCPTVDALYDVIEGGVYTMPGENVCSLFDGAYVVGEATFQGLSILPLGEWHENAGTYVTNLYVLRIGDTKIYGAWPFDLDEHLLTETPPVVGSGFLSTVAYEVWQEEGTVRSVPTVTREIVIVSR